MPPDDPVPGAPVPLDDPVRLGEPTLPDDPTALLVWGPAFN